MTTMAKRRSTSYIVIHCSATRGVQDIGVSEIRRWHKAQGWADVGYHFIVRRNGKVEIGRPVGNVGSHVKGYNHNSVGVCLVGGLDDKTWKPTDNFTAAQWKALATLVGKLVKDYPAAKVLGHRDFPAVAKACPCFPAKTWARKNGFPA
jgi:N-acetylmuramoyl-L-alanine amidase